MKCPGCGAEVSTRTADKVVACRYCETELHNPDPAEPAAAEPPPPPADPEPEPPPETETGEDQAEAKDWTGDVEWPSFEKSVEQATGVDVSGGTTAKRSGCAVLLAVLGGLAATALAIA